MIDMTVLFVFVMVILKRYNQRLLLSYSITFGLALYIAAMIPYLGLTYLTSGAVIPVAGGFVLLIIAELLRNNITLRSKVLLFNCLTSCNCRRFFYIICDWIDLWQWS